MGTAAAGTLQPFLFGRVLGDCLQGALGDASATKGAAFGELEPGNLAMADDVEGNQFQTACGHATSTARTAGSINDDRSRAVFHWRPVNFSSICFQGVRRSLGSGT